ncbi:MAG: 3'(2'),5'-bisphosphate nucleotidase CysQ [Flavobacteriales bacterium]|nr:3'(2'),5'-bisphosphate nucleotidase CysQ [Flavobacteriales bacterium]MDW8432531.1 3'(2'),5'-bisphosphate nucleotidase CysQ [Flavobacteriales bacterium]
MLEFEALKLHGRSSPEAVTEAAWLAGQRLLKYWRRGLEVRQKEDRSPVTDADLEAQRCLNTALETTGLPVFGEENAPFPAVALPDTFWLTDPLDGTKGFIQGSEEFTVNIALIHQKKPIFGLIYAPALGVMYAGSVGEKVVKCFRHDRGWEAHTLENDRRKPEHTLILLSNTSGLQGAALSGAARQFEGQGFRVILKSGRSALKFGWLAEGSAHVYVRDSPCSSWDLAAGQALIEAGGGCVMWPQESQPEDIYGLQLFNEIPMPMFVFGQSSLREKFSFG